MGERKTPKKIAAEAPKRGHLATMVFTGEKLKICAHTTGYSFCHSPLLRAELHVEVIKKWRARRESTPQTSA
jgi:hypothetical protein